jgi:protein-S-isoprenylcysteine O-methyltransferase Ste14
VLHSLLASIPVKNGLKKTLGAKYKYYRLFYTLLAFLFLAGLIYFQFKVPTIKFYGNNIFMLVAGFVLGFCGLALMLICIKKYFMSLSGLRSLVHETAYNSLLITGIHRYVRHPLYLGTFAFIWGSFVIRPYLSVLIANIIITVYTLIGIKLEEDKLIAEYGESYNQYRKNVSRLLPFGRIKQRF